MAFFHAEVPICDYLAHKEEPSRLHGLHSLHFFAWRVEESHASLHCHSHTIYISIIYYYYILLYNSNSGNTFRNVTIPPSSFGTEKDSCRILNEERPCKGSWVDQTYSSTKVIANSFYGESSLFPRLFGGVPKILYKYINKNEKNSHNNHQETNHNVAGSGKEKKAKEKEGPE